MKELGERQRHIAGYGEVTELLSVLVEPSFQYAEHHGYPGAEYEYPAWDGTVNKLTLDELVAQTTGIGKKARARIIGDYDAGVGIMLRSRNLFQRGWHGFFIKPTSFESDEFEILHGPSMKPKDGKVYWGDELVFRGLAKQCSPDLQASLVRTLQQTANQNLSI